MKINKLKSPCWMFILRYIHLKKPKSVSEISKRCGFTYSHTSKIVNQLRKNKVLTCTIEGRNKYVKLTKFGKECSKHCSFLVNHLELNYRYADYMKDIYGMER